MVGIVPLSQCLDRKMMMELLRRRMVKPQREHAQFVRRRRTASFSARRKIELLVQTAAEAGCGVLRKVIFFAGSLRYKHLTTYL